MLGFFLFVVLGVGLGLLAAFVVALVTAAVAAAVGGLICAPFVLLRNWAARVPAGTRTIHAPH